MKNLHFLALIVAASASEMAFSREYTIEEKLVVVDAFVSVCKSHVPKITKEVYSKFESCLSVPEKKEIPLARRSNEYNKMYAESLTGVRDLISKGNGNPVEKCTQLAPTIPFVSPQCENW